MERYIHNALVSNKTVTQEWIEGEKSYQIAKSEDTGRLLLVPRTSTWNKKLTDKFVECEVDGVRLSDYYGFNGDNVNFLTSLPFVKELEVYSDFVRDLSGLRIHSQTIDALSLFVKKSAKIPDVDFPSLKICKLHWFSSARSLLQVDSIRYLNVGGYPFRDLSVVSSGDIVRLHIDSRVIESLEGLNNYRNLQVLSFNGCVKLADWESLRNCLGLLRLEVHSCKQLKSLDCLTVCPALKQVVLENCGDIDSIRPLLCCKSLEKVLLVGNTRVIDGDIGCLSALPKLSTVHYKKYAHYNLPENKWIC